ncbi:MAG: rRNA pseudouridine synthase [Bacteroidales bacterium]|nr:rRNA pseudouridine synthase [Bacteroidales bacterium]
MNTRKELFNKKTKTYEVDSDLIRLNKYISNSGICSRREADELIKAGVVKVNGVSVTELGTKIKKSDSVEYGGQKIKNEKHRYLLLNKPKDYITTVDDPEGRKTVMQLIEGACKERIYPVGRLDRNTTGLLLFTNDGELAKKLTHPKYKVKKIYYAELDNNLKTADMKAIAEGIKLEDGFMKVDNISFITGEKSKKMVGIEIHSGKNRIIHRLFEHLGYKVVRLDRTYYAGLTKKDLPRGRWRFLMDKEINRFKMNQFV